jgi:hypothetical protein
MVQPDQHYVSLASEGGALRLIFVQGLPRSGTTLVTDFIRRHAEVDLMFNSHRAHPSDTDTDEFAPVGAKDYGGSKDCLSPMCGEGGYAGRFTHDAARWNCKAYVTQAQMQGANGTFVVKHPAMLLGGSMLAESCASIGVSARFVRVTRAAAQWEGLKYGCTGKCRSKIISNTERCLAIADEHKAPSTKTVKFEDFDQLSMWRALEDHLNIERIAVVMKPGKAPKVHLSKAKEAGKEQEDAAEQKEGSPAAALPPRVIHRPKGQSDFTVYTGYLEPECSP